MCDILHDLRSVLPLVVQCVNGDAITCTRYGMICGVIVIGGQCINVAITGVCYVPKIKHMLLSPILLADKGLHIEWDSKHGFRFVNLDGQLQLFSIQRGNMLS